MAKVCFKKAVVAGSEKEDQLLRTPFRGSPQECFDWVEENPEKIPRNQNMPDPTYMQILPTAEEEEALIQKIRDRRQREHLDENFNTN